jgi:tRNA pseudouridine55 synthase
MGKLAGLLVLNKPPGISSRAAIDSLGFVLRRTKLGHAGTLDPLASGVLVVCIGKATRLIPFVQRMPKEYRASIRLGQRSDTHDLEGVIETVEVSQPPDAAQFDRCLSGFRGAIDQTPPQHSAVHVGGRRAYELAREGQNVELAPRRVVIDRLACARFDYPEADLEVRCSSGTYVRSLVRDIGTTLGCGAVMTSLIRTAVGPFRLADAIAVDQLQRHHVAERILPPQAAVRDLPVVTLTDDLQTDVCHGRAVPASDQSREFAAGQAFALCSALGELVAVAALDATRTELRPRVVLMEHHEV